MAQSREANRPGSASNHGPGGAELQRPEAPRAPSRELGRSSSPFSFMRRFMDDMDSLFGDFGFRTAVPFGYGWDESNLWTPQLDVTTRDGQLLVHVDLPGLRREDVEITVHDGRLSISGQRENEHEQERGGVFRRERSHGSFRRELALPEGVDPDGIRASFENGVLEITMPLPPESKPKGRSIPITAKPVGGPDVH